MSDPVALRRKYGLSAGWRYPTSGRGHFAWDIACPDGTEILAGCHGTVRAVSDGVPDNRPGTNPGSGAPSNWVLLWTTCEGRPATVYYQHLSEGVPVHQGQDVTPDTVIGYSGNSGNSTGPHLHLSTQWGHTDRRYDPDGGSTIWEPDRVFVPAAAEPEPEPPRRKRQRDMILVTNPHNGAVYLVGATRPIRLFHPDELPQIRAALADPHHIASVTVETWDAMAGDGR